VSILGGGIETPMPGRRGDKSLSIPLMETFRLAWADPDLKSRLMFVLGVFAVFALGVHIPVPVPGLSSEEVYQALQRVQAFQMLDAFGGGALRRVSIFALGLNPYITSSIIMQVLTTAFPQWKKELQEGGEYARKQQNRRTRILTLVLCIVQGAGLLTYLGPAFPAETTVLMKATVVVFWTAGAMFMLWLGEQISEKGIGNGVSLMIFAGIILYLPYLGQRLQDGLQAGAIQWYSIVLSMVVFLVATWFIVMFTIAQRRIPIQHMRRTVGTKVIGGATSYLPLSVMMAGVIPIIFASSLAFIPSQVSMMFGGTGTATGRTLIEIGEWLTPVSPGWKGLTGSLFYTGLIFFFTYFWIAVQYNVEDIANNLKRGGSFIPGVRPGKQTKDFLDGVISRITFVGAAFISVVALIQYLAPTLTGIPLQYTSVIGGTSLLIMVQVALETMRQIEANLLMKQYGS
jgi:preprotein translocase subunit SecY